MAMSGATWLALFIIASLAVITGAVGWWVWTEVGDVAIGTNGWLALGAGTLVTTLLGVGLMMLVWRSHYQGHDEEVGRE